MACGRPFPPRVPNFNVLCNVWFGGILPVPGGPPNIANQPCQIKPGEFTFGTNVSPFMYILFPAGTNVHFNRPGLGGGPDLFELPPGSGMWYQAVYGNDVGFGFPNVYRFMHVQSIPPFPAVLP